MKKIVLPLAHANTACVAQCVRRNANALTNTNKNHCNGYMRA